MKIALAISLASAWGCLGTNPAGTDGGTTGGTTTTKKSPTPKPSGSTGSGGTDGGNATPTPGASATPTATPTAGATATPTAAPTSTPSSNAASGGGLTWPSLASGEKYFYVRIENKSTGKPFYSDTGFTKPVGTSLSNVVWAVHSGTVNPLFTVDDKASAALQSFAEDADASALSSAITTSKKGIVDTPIGQSGKASLAPGQSYHFVVAAKPGEKLVLATQMNESNDTFFSTTNDGIKLWDETDPDNVRPISPGNYTSKIVALDAGTEANQIMAQGADQTPRQAAKNTGAAETANIKELLSISNGNGGTYQPADFIKVTINEYKVKMTVQNVSDSKPIQLDSNSPYFGLPTSAGVLNAFDPTQLPSAKQNHNPYFVGDSSGNKDSDLITLANAGTVSGFSAVAANGGGDANSDHWGAAVIAPAANFNALSLGSSLQVTLPGVQTGLSCISSVDDKVKLSSHRLFMATKLMGGVDLFFAFDKAGLKLFDDNFKFLGGDLTSTDVLLWDAGQNQPKANKDVLNSSGSYPGGDIDPEDSDAGTVGNQPGPVREATGVPTAAKNKILKVSITIAD